MNEHKKYVADTQTELQTYKSELARHQEQLERNSIGRDELLIKDKDREIKRVKAEMEETRDEVARRDRKIADLEVENAQLLNELKMARSQSEIINEEAD
jgi:chromosome segregation ATPase